MRVELFDQILQFMLDFACLVDLDDSSDAVFHDHRVAVFKSLKGVYLESLSFVPIPVLGIVTPDRFTFRVDLNQFLPAGLAKNVAVLSLLNAVNRAGPEFQEDVARFVILDDLAFVAGEYAVPWRRDLCLFFCSGKARKQQETLKDGKNCFVGSHGSITFEFDVGRRKFLLASWVPLNCFEVVNFSKTNSSAISKLSTMEMISY